MENSCIVPHSALIDILFRHKKAVWRTFSDIIGLFNIDHIAINAINENNELIILSHTPAIEFNLFQSNLWHHDRTYQIEWCRQSNQVSDWTSLYALWRYDELYYLKQQKQRFNDTLSFTTTRNHYALVYSFASKQCASTPSQLLLTHAHELCQIGHYCFDALYPLLPPVATNAAQLTSLEKIHDET